MSDFSYFMKAKIHRTLHFALLRLAAMKSPTVCCLLFFQTLSPRQSQGKMANKEAWLPGFMLCSTRVNYFENCIANQSYNRKSINQRIVKEINGTTALRRKGVTVLRRKGVKALRRTSYLFRESMAL
jgi:hypothetical protein